ncbi:membrane protein, putative [Erythrobacter sp. NAP1]|uniref:MFS transporter n=1 Tax=Erythrobacter sp. NAP1 TaxID=237727 RepID=UPI00006851B3|nr:MFS transporter [Erythrobacter sp. NAP1]EAQ27865.1 membrane protein, putative [Erythrobacter sp. NAP1]
MSNPASTAERQPLWFLVLFALAAGGGSIAYVPLLTVLLPLKITELTGAEDVPALAQVTFYGALMASAANIIIGMLSDRSGRRLPWIVAGLAGSSMLLIAIDRASSVSELILFVMLWQVALNMMLSPLFAWAGDCFPDEQKGTLGGALSLAPAMGAIAGSLVTFELLVPTGMRLEVVALMVIVLMVPVTVLGRDRVRPELMQPREQTTQTVSKASDRSTVARMWLARFLIQISEAGLFAFLLFWLRSIVDGFHENTAANIFSIVLVVSVPLALVAGRWSDRAGRPILPLSVCAVLAALGLGTMAIAAGLELAIAGYVVFGIGASIFLSLHTAQTLRVLPQPQHRGRDMGIFNLTNTVPSIVMPWLTLTLVPSFGFAALFALFAGFALLAAILLAALHVRR